MYGFIKGTVDFIDNAFGTLLIDCGGVGYVVNASQNLIQNSKLGDSIKVITHMTVREDDISLYGFVDASEKQMFLKLLSVSGVGAKSALGIVSQISYHDLALQIVQRDVHALTKVKGVGKKTAERIILELRDKFDLTLKEQGSPITQAQNATPRSLFTEAYQGLLALGFRQQEATAMLDGVSGDSAEMMITMALRKRH